MFPPSSSLQDASKSNFCVSNFRDPTVQKIDKSKYYLKVACLLLYAYIDFSTKDKSLILTYRVCNKTNSKVESWSGY